MTKSRPASAARQRESLSSARQPRGLEPTGDARALARRRARGDDVAADVSSTWTSSTARLHREQRRAGRRRLRARPRRRGASMPPREHLPLVVRATDSRTRCAAGTGRAAPRAAGRCPRTRSGSASRGRGTAARAGAWSPSTVTWRSCIASSSAACVFGGARLISSARRRLAKTGPGRNSKSASRWFQIDEPVTSDGSRSGVNCTRAKPRPVTVANERAVSVFASPGTSSSSTWPSARRPSSTSSSRSRLPTTARSISSRTAAAPSRELAQLHREPLQPGDDALDRVAVGCRGPRGRRVPGDRAGRAPSVGAERAAACAGSGRDRRLAGRSSSVAIARSEGRRRKWTSNAVPVASATSRSTRSSDAGRRVRGAPRRGGGRTATAAADTRAAARRARRRARSPSTHEEPDVRDELGAAGDEQQDAPPAPRWRRRAASRAARIDPPHAEPPVACSSASPLRLGAPRARRCTLLERLDRLLLHLRPHIVRRRTSPMEQRRQARDGALGRELARGRASRYSSGASDGVPRAARGREHALQPGVRRDHGAPRIALGPQVVERRLEHVVERLARRLVVGGSRGASPAAARRATRRRAQRERAPGRRRPGQTRTRARSRPRRAGRPGSPAAAPPKSGLRRVASSARPPHERTRAARARRRTSATDLPAPALATGAGSAS